MWDGANITADITGAEKTFYARGTGLIFSEANGQKQYYAFNGHGDTVSVTDAQGKLLQGYDYDAFGNEKGTAQTISNPFRYCGEYYDEETGLIYLRNRYYAPKSGRFTQEDPVKDGLNWFIYCSNNPIRFFDSTGFWAADGSDEKYKVSNSIVYQVIADLSKTWEYLDKLEKQGVNSGTMKNDVADLCEKIRRMGDSKIITTTLCPEVFDVV